MGSDMSSALNDFDRQYQSLLAAVLEEGSRELNKRTGHECISLPGQTLRLNLSAGFPLLALRKIPLKVFIAEQVWFLQGEKDLSWLQEFTKIWDDFSEEDNSVAAAYGYRWRHHFGRDQILELVSLLGRDPSSRHGVVLMWDPADDGLNSPLKKNVPCPYTFTVQIIGGKLCLHLIIRSNDLILGNPHDVAGFALLAYFLAEKLSVHAGTLTVSISNAHLYSIHEDFARTLVSRPLTQAAIPFAMTKNGFDRALAGDRDLVLEIFNQLTDAYDPQPSLGKIPIVL